MGKEAMTSSQNHSFMYYRISYTEMGKEAMTSSQNHSFMYCTAIFA